MYKFYVPHVMMLINVCVCLPLTIMAMCHLFYKARRDVHQVPVYYVNLIISNFIQLSTIIAWVTGKEKFMYPPSVSVHMVGMMTMMTSLGFRMCIALERYFLIACPQLSWIRQVKGSVWVCVAVWWFFLITIPFPFYFSREKIFVYNLSFVPAPVFIICLAGTLKSLLQTKPAASSVPAEEKRRIVGIVVLLLLSYILTILPTAISPMVVAATYYMYRQNTVATILTLNLFSPFLDLILFVFLFKGRIDKLLMCLCCCRMENTAASDDCKPSALMMETQNI